MPAATIRLFLIHGDPKQLRTAEISNWNGKAFAAPRTEFDLFLKREEAQQSGVYTLQGHIPTPRRQPHTSVKRKSCGRE